MAGRTVAVMGLYSTTISCRQIGLPTAGDEGEVDDDHPCLPGLLGRGFAVRLDGPKPAKPKPEQQTTDTDGS